MQAIILAAGMGKRLKKLTSENTKCMVKVNGVTLIERMLNQLEKIHLSRIVIVVGYKGENLISYIATLNIQTPIIFVNNPIYDKTNNIYSLFLAREYLRREDTILLESDLIFDDSILKILIEDERETLALVDKYESWMDGTCLKLTEDDRIKFFVPGKKLKFEDRDEYFKTVNIYKFSKHFSETRYVPFLDAYSKALGNNEYYEQVLKVIMMLEEPEIRAKRLNPDGGASVRHLWYEIDDIQDLDIASSMFNLTNEEKFSAIQKRYGGYWRYPQMLDFCYLVNQCFPPKKLVEELKESAERLLTQYPSGMYVNSLLAAKNFGVEQKNIIVGNGAAELIKSLMNFISGKVGIVRPTFEEYPNRYENTISFEPQNENFSYGAEDLINYFDDKEISNLIVVNPDNPSGNYIPKEKILNLIDWAKSKNIKLIIDESFIDFADENGTLIEQEILDANKNLCIVKSISKSYGVAGLRLGVLASGNEDLIAAMKKDVAIWNINSFAEFYLQIYEKYKGDYLKSLKILREERERFQNELSKIPNIRVIPSQANFVMVEILGKITVRELAEKLLANHNILIKDLSGKIAGKNYLRISVRNSADDDKFIHAMKSEILNK